MIYAQVMKLNEYQRLTLLILADKKTLAAKKAAMTKMNKEEAEHLKDVEEAVNRTGSSQGWLHGEVYLPSHARSIKRNLNWAIQYRANM